MQLAPRGRGTIRAGRGIGTNAPGFSSGSIGVNTPLDDLHIGEVPHGSGSGSGVQGTRSNGRTVAYMQSCVLMPFEKVSFCMRKTFEQKLHPEGLSWKLVPKDTRDDYFDEFKKRFTLSSDISGVVCTAWEEKAAERYKDLIY